MSKRISIKDLEPEAYQAMLTLEHYGQKVPVSKRLKELIKMRASQINGCAYCLDMHTEDALEGGETARRIFALSVWRESHLFSEEERIVLQLTEEVTLIANRGVSDETYRRVVDFFGEKTTAQLIMLVVLINGWNRIAVSTHQIYKD